MKKTVGICTMERFDNRRSNTVGSSRIRARWLLNYWKEAEEYMMGTEYEVIIFQKVYWKNMMEEFEGIKILDICDPDWLEGKPVLEYVDLADATTTSTEELAEYLRKLRPNALIRCIPDRVYIPEHIPVKKTHKGIAKTVGWFGYHHNIHYLTKTFDEIIKHNLELTLISDQAYDVPIGFSGLQVNNVAYAYPRIHTEISMLDMVVMPDPQGDERARFKSNNKTLQVQALGVPVAKVPEDMARFMKPEERNKEAQAKLLEVKEKWDVKISVVEMKKLIEEIKQKKLSNKK